MSNPPSRAHQVTNTSAGAPSEVDGHGSPDARRPAADEPDGRGFVAAVASSLATRILGQGPNFVRGIFQGNNEVSDDAQSVDDGADVGTWTSVQRRRLAAINKHLARLGRRNREEGGVTAPPPRRPPLEVSSGFEFCEEVSVERTQRTGKYGEKGECYFLSFLHFGGRWCIRSLYRALLRRRRFQLSVIATALLTHLYWVPNSQR